MTSATIKCPTCGRAVVWSRQSPWRPFCSPRCKLIDLGAWFSEARSIASSDNAHPEDHDEAYAEREAET